MNVRNAGQKSSGRRKGTFEVATFTDGTTVFRGRLRLADGTKSDRFDLPEGLDETKARAYLAALQAEEDRTGVLLAAKLERARDVAAARGEGAVGETCNAYFTRFLEHRKAVGKVRRTRDLEGAWNTWIAPKLGNKPIAEVSRDDVEDVRDALDEEVARRKKEGGLAGLSAARARNVWSVLTSMMKEACTSKKRDLRVRADNPCRDVQPPDKGDARTKTFIYPVEFLTLMTCEDVPLAWRELYALACYLYLRPGELRALVWSDVDFAAGVVHVTKAYDEDSETVKAPKTRNGVRDVPIPATLLPLLSRMHEGKDASAPVVPLMAECSERRRAGVFRDHLALAKLDRARLTEKSPTTMPVNFRSWRDTGVTWLALAGVGVDKMQRRAGHERIETTLGYVKMAEDLTGSIGEPFPPLPESLVAPRPTVRLDQTLAQLRANSPKSLRRGRDSNPRQGFSPAPA